MALSPTSTTTQELHTQWASISDEQLTLHDLEATLTPIANDLWVAAACVDRLLEDVVLERSLLELGLKRTEAALERSKKVYESSLSGLGEQQEELPGSSSWSEERRRSAALATYYREEPTDAQLCHLRTIFLDRLDRLEAYGRIAEEMPEQETVGEEIDEEWEDDPWADDKPVAPPKRVPLPLPLVAFLVDDLVTTTCYLVSTEQFVPAHIVLDRFGPAIWPFRFAILESIPEHSLASEYRDLLPSIDSSGQSEERPPFAPRRSTLDWTELPGFRNALAEAHIPLKLLIQVSQDHNTPSRPDPLSSEELSLWYRERIEGLNSSGFVDSALSLVQHAASHGVPGLDEVGEELSLLSRLVYDVAPPANVEVEDEWDFNRWKALTPSDIIRAYLAHSSSDTVVQDIHRLVMPYLYVLESRAERSGNTDPSLPNRLLYEYILQAPLDKVLAIFEGSKPTLPPAHRLIRDDEDMARIALACLYGSNSLDEWGTMSRIFECLPAWDTPEDGDETDEVDTTIASLGAFVVPSTARPRCTPSDLLLFFKPLPFTSLSRALDVLDVHLESGEILARWSVPAPLRWFLQSNGSITEQRSWANRMARRAGGTDDMLSSQDDWEWLLEDMLKLAGSGDTELRGAFCLLSRDDITRIFFSGLLSAAKFDIAKALLHSKKANIQLSRDVVEDICLASSQEFYDNASSGNYHFGEMKLAYDCLDVAHPSETIQRQKDFIEATSRLCSYNITSRPGIPISPIEIRLTKDRLSLISRVLSSNSDAYKHTQVILDLANMLGFKGDVVAEVKTLAMLADTALQAEDFNLAYESSVRMVSTVLDFRVSSSYGIDDPKVQEASEVCWIACYQLGRQPEFADVGKKLSLLGRALELCPSDKLADVLTARRPIEEEDKEERQASLAARQRGARTTISRKHASRVNGNTVSLASRLQELRMPNLSSPITPDPAALAEKAFRAAANFSFSDFSARGRSLISDAARERSTSGSRTRYDGAEVSAQAQKVLSKGLGWLLGDDDK
ncbi:Sec39-domain-containing protein [Cristinia sonorae]|uniref:Sec39-domain-containing protein n=1 Tax=Cristinia sonorae TaxID=1940300 RepID=A0A8K0URX0_9AGAR|nr:Sec39-domain-containing protein [Cristinia sonorae]